MFSVTITDGNTCPVISPATEMCFFGRSAHACLDRRKPGLTTALSLQRWTSRLKSAGRSIAHVRRKFGVVQSDGANAFWSTSTDFVYQCTRGVTSTMTKVSRQRFVTRWLRTRLAVGISEVSFGIHHSLIGRLCDFRLTPESELGTEQAEIHNHNKLK